MKRTQARILLCSVLIGGLLLFIWGNSLLPAELSLKLSDWVKTLLTWGSSSGAVAGSSGFLRKIAHFSEFAVLGMSLGWLFGMLGKRWYFPLLLGFSAACVDETIQFFVPGRGPGLFDVALDTAGVAVGLGLLLIGYTVIKKKKQYILEETNQ